MNSMNSEVYTKSIELLGNRKIFKSSSHQTKEDQLIQTLDEQNKQLNEKNIELQKQNLQIEQLQNRIHQLNNMVDVKVNNDSLLINDFINNNDDNVVTIMKEYLCMKQYIKSLPKNK